ncbi:DUF6602 domain-containing protein [Xanthobacter flavus]|uniref:DUF6602 domain-containing protein n=1 Tax=Xanthobacter flavus TaxID=281 RepID=UPI003726A770
MDGQRLRNFWNQEVSALLAVYRQFETLLPSTVRVGADHRGEDGRYVENLIRSYLQKFLPKDLEVLTGFILKPAVKLGTQDRARKSDEDQHTTQLDIIVYDTGTYPVFQRMGETVIVPPEGVVAILSVKKTLRDADVVAESLALMEASRICRCDQSDAERRRRGPFLALVGAGSQLADTKVVKEDQILKRLRELYAPPVAFDDMIGFVGDLSGWHVFKSRPPRKLTDNKRHARYLYLDSDADHLHQGFQFILSGILSVYYDESRRNVKRPGFTAFPARPARALGEIPFQSLR